MEQLTIGRPEINATRTEPDSVAPPRPTNVLPFPKTSDLVQIEPLSPPPGTSKSIVQAMQCPDFMVRVYSRRTSVANRNEWLKDSGIQFHDYFRGLNNHLRDHQLWEDTGWRDRYLERPDLSPDARAVIARHEWRVDPRTIVAVEEMFSVDRQMNPLPMEFGKQPGDASSHDNVLVWGTPDLVLLEERKDRSRKATVIDPKTGWSTVNVGNYEPLYYAGLVMKHFERVDEVEFIWKYPRFQKQKSATYTRSFLSQIEQMWRYFDHKMNEYFAAHNRGERLPVDPSAGMCPYCPLNCEMRQRAGELVAGPVQTNEDAVQAVHALQALEGGAEQIRAYLRPWITANGKVDAGNGFFADFKVYATREYPLRDALPLLGLADKLPVKTPVGDIPLDHITIGGLTDYLNRKKRAVLQQAMHEIANESCSSRLTVFRREEEPEPPDLEEQLVRSIEAVTQTRPT